MMFAIDSTVEHKKRKEKKKPGIQILTRSQAHRV